MIVMREYVLLYYRDVNLKGFEEMARNKDVTYCVNLGNLPDVTAETIAKEHEGVFYCDPKREVYFLRGWFDGSLHPDAKYEGQLLVIRPSDTLCEEMKGVCVRAMGDFIWEKNNHIPECSDGWFDRMCMIRHCVEVSMGSRIEHSACDRVDELLAGIAERLQLIQAGDGKNTPQSVVKRLAPPADKASTETLLVELREDKNIDHNKIIRGIFKRFPKTKTLNSSQLLRYYQGFAKKHGIEITIGESRIRQLPVWKENDAYRRSGKTQLRREMGDTPDEGAVDVNDPDYEIGDNQRPLTPKEKNLMSI